MNSLSGKIALVTGGSGRIGSGIAQGLGEAGTTVYITARTLKESEKSKGTVGSLKETVRAAEALGGKAIPIQRS